MGPKEYQLFERDGPRVQLGHELTEGKRVHPMIFEFMRYSNFEIAELYCRNNPEVDYLGVMQVLSTPVKHMRWSGSDLLSVEDTSGRRGKVVLETNSCPSGSLDFPTLGSEQMGGTPYSKIIKGALLPQLDFSREGDLAVIWDKNRRGTRAYAQTLADETGRRVHWMSLMKSEGFRFEDLDHLTYEDRDIIGAFRYVTQAPWERLAVDSSLPMVNPVIACLAGGRNKLVAAKAYDTYNLDPLNQVKVNIPHTTGELSFDQVIMLVEDWAYVAVVKDPYSNAGQGVFTITSRKELDEFVKTADNDRIYIVQQLIGNTSTTSNGKLEPLVHTGTTSANGNSYAFDVRMMVVNTPEGYRPVSMYGRRAKAPLESRVGGEISSWDVFGTNLSVKLGADKWKYDEEERQIVVTDNQFGEMNLSIADIADIYLQAVVSNLAINQMADRLMRYGTFDFKLFSRLNKDPGLVDTIARL
jgi:hypothetical protein